MLYRFTTDFWSNSVLIMSIFAFLFSHAAEINETEKNSLLCQSLIQTAQYVLDGKISKEAAEKSLPNDLKEPFLALIESQNNPVKALLLEKFWSTTNRDLSLLKKCGNTEQKVNEFIKNYETRQNKDYLQSLIFDYLFNNSDKEKKRVSMEAIKLALDLHLYEIDEDAFYNYLDAAIAGNEPELLAILLKQPSAKLALNTTKTVNLSPDKPEQRSILNKALQNAIFHLTSLIDEEYDKFKSFNMVKMILNEKPNIREQDQTYLTRLSKITGFDL